MCLVFWFKKATSHSLSMGHIKSNTFIFSWAMDQIFRKLGFGFLPVPRTADTARIRKKTFRIESVMETKKNKTTDTQRSRGESQLLRFGQHLLMEENPKKSQQGHVFPSRSWQLTKPQLATKKSASLEEKTKTPTRSDGSRVKKNSASFLERMMVQNYNFQWWIYFFLTPSVPASLILQSFQSRCSALMPGLLHHDGEAGQAWTSESFVGKNGDCWVVRFMIRYTYTYIYIYIYIYIHKHINIH